MGAPVHEDLGLGKAHKRQITDEVQQLMAHRFVGKAQGGFIQ